MSTFRQKFQATTNWVKPKPEGLAEAPRGARPASSRKRRSAPVTAHRLFPAFAAVWLAALLGLGSLAIPGSLLGALVLKVGLPALVPAAAPPLGFTAHLLLAFVLAAFGAALGLAFALRLRPRGAADVRPVEASVPAAEPEADEAYKVRARDAHPDAPPRRPLVLTEAFAEPLGEVPEFAEPLLRRKLAFQINEPANEPAAEPAMELLDLAALDLVDVAHEPAEEPAFDAPQDQPIEAPAIPVLIAATPQLPAGFAAALPDVSDGTWSPVAGAPLESLGLVQLIERLALAIATQKAANAAVIAAEPRAATEDATEFDARPAEPQFEAGPFSQPQPDDMVGDTDAASAVPAIGSAREAILRRLGAMAAGGHGDEANRDVGAAPLFSRPAPVEAVVPLRAVASVGPAPAPLEADEALRSALATLQRMTARA